MKRKFFRASWMLALAGMVAFTFVGTSCGDDDDDSPAPTPSNNTGTDTDKDKDKDKDKDGEEQQADENKYIVVHTQDLEKHTWDSQFWFKSNVPFVTGDEWEISLWVKAEKKVEATYTDNEGKETTVTALSTQVHNGAGHYMHWAAVGSVPFDTEWTEYKKTGTFSAEMNGGNMICFNLNDYHEANTYYFDQISFKINGVEVVNNGFLETDDYSAFFVKEHQPADDGVDVFIDDPITADNIESAPKEDWWKEAPKVTGEPELSEEEKNLKYDNPKTLSWKSQWSAINILVKEEWTSLSITFDGKPENVQFCISSDFVTGKADWNPEQDVYQTSYLPIEDAEANVDLAAVLADMKTREGDGSTKITTVGIQYTAAFEEGAEPATAKVLTIVATLNDGSKKLVKALSPGWNTDVTK